MTIVKDRGAFVRRGWVALFACLGFGCSLLAAAQAPDDQAVSDARCVVVAMHMATLNAPQQRSTGVMLAIYYLGRLDGRSPQANTEKLIEAEAGKMTPADLRSDAVQCGKVLTAKGQEMMRDRGDLEEGLLGRQAG
jgi:hypothetical protein